MSSGAAVQEGKAVITLKNIDRYAASQHKWLPLALGWTLARIGTAVSGEGMLSLIG